MPSYTRTTARRTHFAAIALTLLALPFLPAPLGVNALGQQQCVSFSEGPSTFPVVGAHHDAAPILLSPDDYAGVHRTAADFREDIHAVTDVQPTLRNVSVAVPSTTSNATAANVNVTTSLAGIQRAIIVGTLGHSPLIDAVMRSSSARDAFGALEGAWEAFVAREIDDPLPGSGIKSAYVIVGSDMRGTIYGMYDHSEQFGASCVSWICAGY